MALIDSAFDRNEECQDIIGLSLFNLGKKKPELVLSSCYSYLHKHSKVCLFSVYLCIVQLLYIVVVYIVMAIKRNTTLFINVQYFFSEEIVHKRSTLIARFW